MSAPADRKHHSESTGPASTASACHSQSVLQSCVWMQQERSRIKLYARDESSSSLQSNEKKEKSL